MDLFRGVLGEDFAHMHALKRGSHEYYDNTRQVLPLLKCEQLQSLEDGDYNLVLCSGLVAC